jgi:hypothetical protein
MTVTYAGLPVSLSVEQTQKLDHEFQKTGKLLDNGKSEVGIHVFISQERHLHIAEATAHVHHHDLAGKGTGDDIFAAIHQAAVKLETQAIRLKEKWRDEKRGTRAVGSEEISGEESVSKAG